MPTDGTKPFQTPFFCLPDINKLLISIRSLSPLSFNQELRTNEIMKARAPPLPAASAGSAGWVGW